MFVEVKSDKYLCKEWRNRASGRSSNHAYFLNSVHLIFVRTHKVLKATYSAQFYWNDWLSWKNWTLQLREKQKINLKLIDMPWKMVNSNVQYGLHVVSQLKLAKPLIWAFKICMGGIVEWMISFITDIFVNLWLWNDLNDSGGTSLQLLVFLLLYKESRLNWQTSLRPSGTANGVTSSRRWSEISHSVTGCSLLGLVRRLRVFPRCSNCSQSATCAGRFMRW